MPWLETDLMTERLKFVQDALSDRFTMSELCARYGISRRITMPARPRGVAARVAYDTSAAADGHSGDRVPRA